MAHGPNDDDDDDDDDDDNDGGPNVLLPCPPAADIYLTFSFFLSRFSSFLFSLLLKSPLDSKRKKHFILPTLSAKTPVQYMIIAI